LADDMRHYTIFGLHLVSDYPFANHLAELPPGAEKRSEDLIFQCCSTAPVSVDWQSASPLYTSARSTVGGVPFVMLYRGDGFDLLRYGIGVDFYLWPGRIFCHLHQEEHAYFVEIALLGSVLAYYLEWRGIRTLHASAVSGENGAVAFLASNRGGKSSLAAGLMQLGHPLLTDDVLALEQQGGMFLGRPGYPSMRFWPEEMERFAGQQDAGEIVHPEIEKRRVGLEAGGLGDFCTAPQPVRALYIPERCELGSDCTTTRILPLPPGEAVVHLLRNSFVGRLVNGAGMAAQRLDFLVQLTKCVPVLRLVYPSGFENLPAVCQFVQADWLSRSTQT